MKVNDGRERITVKRYATSFRFAPDIERKLNEMVEGGAGRRSEIVQAAIENYYHDWKALRAPAANGEKGEGRGVMALCQKCKKREALWAVQWIAGELSVTYLGAHYRGFRVVKMCDECKEAERAAEREGTAVPA